MGNFFPPILVLLVAFCGFTGAVNECLDLNTGRCTFASRYELDLGWCDLTDEDVEAGDLKACFENFGENNIHQLYMSSNDLTTPPAGMFDSLQAMTLLYLGYNRLETLPAGMFGSLPALTNLNLRTNNLATLPAGIFDSLTGLTELDVTYNQMATLPTGIFSSVPSLTKLDLSFNGLTTLPAGMFDSDNQLTNMLHQIAMRDPTDKYDLPDHLTWQMNMAVDHNEVSHDAKGILGETFIPTRDANGKPIMAGMEAIRGQQEHYRVDGALGMDFVQNGHL